MISSSEESDQEVFFQEQSITLFTILLPKGIEEDAAEKEDYHRRGG
jgi:hypothetical protein